MYVSLDIEVDGIAEVLRKLEAMELRATNFRPVFWWAREELARANARNFASNGLPVGGWAPRDASIDYAWAPLVRTGRLSESLTTLAGPPNDIGRNSATFGTNVEYARFHQSGTRHMPARRIVFEPVGFAREVGSRAADWIVDGIVD